MSGEQEQKTAQSPDDWVRLISSDGFTYLVRRKVAHCSGMLKNTLDIDGSFLESASNTCVMPRERGAVVEKLCEYLAYKSLYGQASAKEDIPDFIERIAPEVALELLMAADYYDGSCPMIIVSIPMELIYVLA